MKTFKQFLADENGATTLEYAILAALIVIVSIGAITSLSSKLSLTFAKAGNAQPVP